MLPSITGAMQVVLRQQGVSFLRPPPQGNPAPRCNTVSSPIQVLVHGRLGRNESTGLWWIPAFVYLRIKKKKKARPNLQKLIFIVSILLNLILLIPCDATFAISCNGLFIGVRLTLC